MNLDTRLEYISGVGKATMTQLQRAGIETVGDLVWFLPRRHEDFSQLCPIADIKPGKMTIRARCEEVSTRQVRRGLRLTTAVLSDDTGKLRAIWFNQPYRQTQLKGNGEFFFSGEFEFKYNRYQLTSPSVEKVDKETVQTDRLLPVYSATAGLKSAVVRKVLSKIRPILRFLPDSMPSSVIAYEHLIPLGEALEKIHFPENEHDVALARERLGFDELFGLTLASQLNKRSNAQLEGWHIPFDQPLMKQFVTGLPFELTNAQRRAIWDIVQDFDKSIPMNRLLQGDVGSGKTVVAGAAALQAVKAGYQAAILAPTDILASQHAKTLDQLLSQYGVKVALLTGRVKGVARKELYQHVADGTVDLLIGTHAIIQDKLSYHKLGFVVIDEQHRFGVKQRQALLDKAQRLPHLLAMTATPIPRSLALTVYGELDVSILNELPKGRCPIKTTLVSPNSTKPMYQAINAELDAGRQVYIICSLIDDNPDNDVKSVQPEAKHLHETVFKGRQLAVLHGKMPSSEKQAVMDAFLKHETDVLVSTTVVEVGVDVPNATVIVIQNADHFGLAQLHQLRGRVGRGEYQSYAYMVLSDSTKPTQRLREIEKTNDGFKLAEVDLRLRGPGEIYGKSQHGELNLKIATLADTRAIYRAQQAAIRFLDSGEPLGNYPDLDHRIEKYQRLTTLN